MPKLSIVIPTYNEEECLPGLLRSIAEQNWRDYEVIVSDAGSTDATQRIAREFGASVVEELPRLGEVRGDPDPQALDGEGKALWQKLHATVKKVTEELGERLGLNTAVAAIMELANAQSAYVERPDAEGRLVRRVMRDLVLLLSSFTPFLAEELWSRLGEGKLVLETPWPEYVPAVVGKEVERVIAVPGKLVSIGVRP